MNTQPTITPLGQFQSALHEFNRFYEDISRGTDWGLDSDRLLYITTLADVRKRAREVSPAERANVDWNTLGAQDRAIQNFVFTKMVDEIDDARLPVQAAASFSRLHKMMKRFGTTPKKFLAMLVESRHEKITEALCKGIDATLNCYLTRQFEKAALYPEDHAMLSAGLGSDSDRLNAILRPVEDAKLLPLLHLTEETYALAGRDMFAEKGFIERIMPRNVLKNAYANVAKDDRPSKFQIIYQDIREDMAGTRAGRIEDVAKAYARVMLRLQESGLTPVKLASLYPVEAEKPAQLQPFQAAAIKYAKYHLLDVLTHHPLTEDDIAAIRDPAVEPIDQLNILFRDSGKLGVKLLTVIEESGIELDTRGLAQQIFEARDLAGATPQRAALLSPPVRGR